MRFVDANVFIYAILKPKRELKAEDRRMKELARAIIARIEHGERVVTSIVHISEVLNVVEDYMPVEEQKRFVESILFSNTMEILDAGRDDYILAVELASEHRIGVNDALAVVLMQRKNITQIYSFDRHLDLVPGIERLSR